MLCADVMANNALEAIERQVADPNAAAALKTLQNLTMLQIIKEDGADFEALDRPQLRRIGTMITEHLDAVRPDAVALSDGLGFEDHNLK